MVKQTNKQTKNIETREVCRYIDYNLENAMRITLPPPHPTLQIFFRRADGYHQFFMLASELHVSFHMVVSTTSYVKRTCYENLYMLNYTCDLIL